MEHLGEEEVAGRAPEKGNQRHKPAPDPLSQRHALDRQSGPTGQLIAWQQFHGHLTHQGCWFLMWGGEIKVMRTRLLMAKIEQQDPQVQTIVAGSPHQVNAKGSMNSTANDEKKMPSEMYSWKIAGWSCTCEVAATWRVRAFFSQCSYRCHFDCSTEHARAGGQHR